MVTPRFTSFARRCLRWTTLAFLAVGFAPVGLQGQTEAGEITVIGPQGKQTIGVSVFAGGVQMVPLDEIAPLVGGDIDRETESAELAVDGRTARIFTGRSFVQIEGRHILLSGPVTVRDGQWFVPLDFLDKVLPLVTENQVTYRADERLLILGAGFPRVNIRALAYPNYTRVVVESNTSVPFQVSQAADEIQVLIQAPYIESDFLSQELRDGVVDTLSLARLGEGYLLTVRLGDRFGDLKPFELENPHRLVLDMFRSRVPTEPPSGIPILVGPPRPGEELPEPPPKPEPPDRVEPARDSGDLRIITLDPGHGGAETGATGPTGLLEKDVALSISGRLSTLLENRLGIRVLSTRDGDSNLPLDERTAIANNNKSDIFISIHVNASPRTNARGSSVYFLSYEASDEESRRVANAENDPTGIPQLPPTDHDLQFILWDMAQAAYLNESAILAEILQEELVDNSGQGNNRGIKQAPFRVLMGATMPAVLVEVAFITNPEEERLLKTDEFQDQIAQAVYRGIVRYKERYERRLGMSGDSGSPREER